MQADENQCHTLKKKNDPKVPKCLYAGKRSGKRDVSFIHLLSALPFRPLMQIFYSCSQLWGTGCDFISRVESLSLM